MPTTPDESFRVSVDGQVYDIDPGDFDRREWRALREVTGLNTVQALGAMAQLDLDAMAGMVWLVRRRDEPDLAYDDVNLRLSDLYETEGAEVASNPPG